MTITSLNIADGTVGRTRLPKLKRKYIVIAAITTVIVILLALAYCYDIFAKKKSTEVLVPPDPTSPLPPSASRQHTFKRAAVCADGAVCADIGKSILEKNGSAVDAAIGTMFCNGIVTMQSMGLGGGFLMTVYIRQNQTAFTLNARERAPGKATTDMYKDKSQSQKGPLAIAVPGELKGYWTAHQRFGKLRWEEIIAPSIEVCEQGYNMTRHQYNSLSKHILHNVTDTNFRQWFFESDGNYKQVGSKIIPTKLCETLKLIAKNGGDDLYNGTLSKMLVEDIKEIGGIINEEDLASYTAEWMDPIQVTFKNKHKLYSVPPPGSGALLGFILNILDGFEFTSEAIDGIDNTINTYHKIIEAFKYAFARRTELGDTDFVNITNLLHNLTSATYAEEIRKNIKDNYTSHDPRDYGAVFYSSDDHGTAHISVLAENGDAVSVTSSINIYFGAGTTSRQTGIIFNSVMDDFSFPHFENYFGLPGSPNNKMEPGKRPLSSMSPGIIADENGDAKLVIGASGGTKITTAIALVIMRTLWFGQGIKEAVDAPRFHHQLYPMTVQYEYGNLKQVIDGLELIGHKMQRYKDAGSVICALLKIKNIIYGNADYRKGGDVYGID